MARCELTDLPADMCAHCLGHADPQQQAAADRSRLLSSGWFAAMWPGTCELCGEPFEAGAAIRPHLPTGWRAECCPIRTVQES